MPRIAETGVAPARLVPRCWRSAVEGRIRIARAFRALPTSRILAIPVVVARTFKASRRDVAPRDASRYRLLDGGTFPCMRM